MFPLSRKSKEILGRNLIRKFKKMANHFHTVARKHTWIYSLIIRNENFKDNFAFLIYIIYSSMQFMSQFETYFRLYYPDSLFCLASQIKNLSIEQKKGITTNISTSITIQFTCFKRHSKHGLEPECYNCLQFTACQIIDIIFLSHALNLKKNPREKLRCLNN